MNYLGVLIGLSTFLIIGLFHPVVIKCEYYFGTRCWWWFLVLGLVGVVGSLLVSSVFLSTLLGVVAFSSFWTIMELFEQRQRVRKGWFPANPRRPCAEKPFAGNFAKTPFVEKSFVEKPAKNTNK